MPRKNKKKKLVSIIIPAYKQEKTIRKDILNIYDTMSQTRWNFEIIVVVDGMVDKTFERLKPIRKKKIKVFRYKTNRGKGYALRYGTARSVGDYVCFLDAGMDIDPNGISMLLEHMEWYGADVVIGSSRHPASKSNYPLIRKIYSAGYHTLVRILFGLKVKDTQRGMKVFRREVLEKILPRLLVKRFATDIEMLAVAKHLGFGKIYEAPVDVNWEENKTSFTGKVLFDKNIQRMIIDTLAVFYRLKILRYYRDENRDRWLYRKELDIKADIRGKEDIKFSIIIPVRKINNYVKESIPHILNLNYQNFEVIIISDRSERNTFRDRRVKTMSSKDPTPSPKRNLGAKKAKGEILVFMDDDAFPEDDWLDRAYEIFKDRSVYALGGPAATPKEVGLLERLGGRVFESWLASGGTTYRYRPRQERLVKDYPSVNLFVRKKAFNKIGGFSTEFWPGEDTKLCLDLVNLHGGRGFPYDPSPIVYHHRRELLLPHLKQVSRYGRHRGQFAKIFPETSRVPSYFVPLLFVLGLVLGPVASIFIPKLWVVYFCVLAAYLVLLLIESINVFLSELSFKALIYFMIGIFWTHVVYGVNFLIGLIKKPKLTPKKVDYKTGKYLEG
ncbi:glycosyltransferase [Patescibacteria group bacterium]